MVYTVVLAQKERSRRDLKRSVFGIFVDIIKSRKLRTRAGNNDTGPNSGLGMFKGTAKEIYVKILDRKKQKML